ncbi:MAG: hydroxymethylglutaryl-CoA lyase [Pseudomonadales bacterium]|nr:hydroxymethylglutaryl-CoA lyase [Pseudomonadales bacterium]
MDHVIIQEVGLRDGLQNQPRNISTADKLALAWSLLDSGIKQLEVTSFVSPRAVPQMSDAALLTESLFAYLKAERPDFDSSGLSALVPNRRGYDSAKIFPYQQLAVVLATTDDFNQRNLNMTTASALTVVKQLMVQAKSDGLRMRVYLSGAMGCPYKGPVPVSDVLILAEQLLTLGADELVISDTTGAGCAKLARELLRPLIALAGTDRLGLHLHDTRGQALAIALAGLDCGIHRFDASVGGLGGCRYVTEATGNVATEDLVYLCEREGYSTGIDINKLQQSVAFASSITGQTLGGKVSIWLRSQQQDCAWS